MEKPLHVRYEVPYLIRYSPGGARLPADSRPSPTTYLVHRAPLSHVNACFSTLFSTCHVSYLARHRSKIMGLCTQSRTRSTTSRSNVGDILPPITPKA